MKRERLLQLCSVAAPIVVWELAVGVFGVVSPTVLPPPRGIAETTAGLLVDGTFLSHVAATVRRTLLASVVGSVLGTVVGLAMGWARGVKALLSPLAAAIFPLPTVALLPLLILVLGSNERALVVTAALGAFFLVLWNAMTGARGVESVYVDVARDNGATSTYALFREVLLPGSMPLVLVGLRLGLTTSLLIVVAVEFVAGGAGLGYVLWISWTSYELPVMYATLVVVGGFGAAITYGLSYLHYRLIPWEADIERKAIV